MLDQTKHTNDGVGSDDPTSSEIRVTPRDGDGVHAMATSYDEDESAQGSLIEDVTALYENGKTYVASELAFQKTRAQYGAKQGGKIAAFGIGALALANLALIGLTIGLIMALATLVGPLAATLIVTAVLLIGAGVLAYMAKNKVTEVTRVMSGGKP